MTRFKLLKHRLIINEVLLVKAILTANSIFDATFFKACVQRLCFAAVPTEELNETEYVFPETE